MDCKKLMAGIFGVVAVGYAAYSAAQFCGDWKNSQTPGEWQEVRLKTIFGVNDEMLADTNRFPASSDCSIDVNLPKEMDGFKSASFSLANANGKFAIYSVNMCKTLPESADDGDLRKAFKSAVDMVGKEIAVAMDCPELKDVNEWRGRMKVLRGGSPRLATTAEFKLADGYEIAVDARDATYVKRNGNFHLVSPAVVEVRIRSGRSEWMGLKTRLQPNAECKAPAASARNVDFGVDLSQQLSEAVKERAAARSGGGRCKSCL